MAFKQPEPANEVLSAFETATEYKVKSPSGTQVGDVILAGLITFATGRTYTATGWTQLGTTGSVTGGQAAYFYRVAAEAGEKTYAIKISGASAGSNWGTTRITKVNPSTPVVGSATTAANASTTIKWATGTPTEVTCMDYLFDVQAEASTITTPTGFTRYAGGTEANLPHGFGREYTKKEATGESSATQGKSLAYGTLRVFILGEEEAGGKTVQGAASLTGTGSLSAVPQRIVFGKASLTGTGSLSSSASATHYGKASLAGTGSLSATGRRTALGAAVLSGLGSLSAKATQTQMGKAALSGLGSLSSGAVRTRFGQALLTGIGSLVASGTTEHKTTSGLPRRPYGRRYKIHNPPE